MEPYYATPDGKVTLYAGHVLDVLREMPAESVNCVVTSPPYWSLRKYDCEPVVWGGDPECEHEWADVAKNGAVEAYAGAGRWQHGGHSRDESPGDWTRLTQGTHTCRLCGAWRGQYGLEPTPELYVEHTLMWLREVRRVLRKDGTCWLNIGDGYWGGKGQSGAPQDFEDAGRRGRGETIQRGEYNIATHGTTRPSDRRHPNLKPKDAVLMPFRVALAAQADGWWVRSVIIWAKPNPMPESVRDRPTDAHEYIFLLTKSKAYWYDQDAVRENFAEGTAERISQPDLDRQQGGYKADAYQADFPGRKKRDRRPADVLRAMRDNGHNGRNVRSVWTFPTEPFPDAHFAVFPRELPERCIKAGCPEWVCPKCGKARVRVTEIVSRKEHPAREHRNVRNKADFDGADYARRECTLGLVPDKTVESWSDCGCGEPFVGGIVLDPFAGSGTTCEVAYHLGRTAIGIDASAKYLDMAIERVKQGVLPFGDKPRDIPATAVDSG